MYNGQVYNGFIESRGENMDVTEIGLRIKFYREQNNITQADMAEQLELTTSALSKIESGKQKVDAVTLIEFLKISKDYDWIFDIQNDDLDFTRSENIHIEKGSSSIFNQFVSFCKSYPQKISEKFSGNETGGLIRHQLPLDLLEKSNLDMKLYKAYGSVGIGSWAKIPWIAFLDKSITDTVQKGIYVSYFFRGDGKGFYLSLNQGYAFFQERYGDEAKSAIKKVAVQLKKELRTVGDQMQTKEISLDSETSLGLAYEYGHILGKYYDVNDEIKDEDFVSDFKSLMLTYKEVSGLLKGKSYEAFADSIINYQSLEFTTEIEDKNFIDSIYFNSKSETFKPDFLTEIDGKKMIFEVKNYKATVRRNPMIARQSLEIANYKCEFDPDHETFLTNSEKPYMEVHHLIPINEQENFEYYLDNSANIVVLCPNCHKAIHHGSDEIKEKMLRQLFFSRIEKLESKGIELTFSQLKKMYKVDDKTREESE